MAHVTTRLLRGSAAVVGANLVFSAATFALATVAARRLGPVAFGEWGALWALMMVSAALFPSVSMAAARETSLRLARGDAADAAVWVRRAARFVLAIGVAVAALLIAGATPVSGWLRIADAGHVRWVGVFFFVSILLAFTRGVVEGAQRFDALGVNLVWEGALRAIVGFALLGAGFGVEGLLFGYVFGAAAALVRSWPSMTEPPDLWNGPPGSRVRVDAAELPPAPLFVGPILAAHIVIVVLANADMVAAKHAFDASAAGWWSVAFTGGKFLFFLAEGIGTVMFPLAVEAHARREPNLPILARALGLFAAAAGVALAVVMLAPDLVVDRVFGARYAAVREILPRYLIWATWLSATVLVVKFRLAQGKVDALVFLTGFAIGLAGELALRHWQPMLLSSVLSSLGATMFAVTVIGTLVFARRAARRAARSGAVGTAT
ncbi:MAG: hypothetical protein KJ042_10690 [Deltaproteobacteria bacterium]|nr:hypothetical protein [Deltaproteobacteria bacterium]